MDLQDAAAGEGEEVKAGEGGGGEEEGRSAAGDKSKRASSKHLFDDEAAEVRERSCLCGCLLLGVCSDRRRGGCCVRCVLWFC